MVTFPKRTYRWPRSTQKDAQCHSPSANANQTTTRCHLPIDNGYYQKAREDKRQRGCAEKESLVLSRWECKVVRPPWETVRRRLENLKVELLYNLAILLMDIHPKEIKLLSQRDICTPIFTLGKIWKQPASVDR